MATTTRKSAASQARAAKQPAKTPAKRTPAPTAAPTSEPASTPTPTAPGFTTSLRDADRSQFNVQVRTLQKAVGVELAHTFAHLSWTTTQTDPATIDGVQVGNLRRNNAVAWLRSAEVIDKPVAEQVQTLVTALREAAAPSEIVDRIEAHYGLAAPDAADVL